jgi:hypothetical protein
MARDRATVKAELEAAEAERATATGRAKAALTRKVKALQAELETMPAAVKTWPKSAVFDSATIVRVANGLPEGSDGDALAAALEMELDGRLKRRIRCLAERDELISRSFTSWAKPVKAKAKAEQPTPDLAKQLADSVAQVKAAKRTKKA